MKWLDEVRSVEIAEIRKPDDWETVLAEDRTKALAANMPQTDGPVNLPVLNAATMDIVAGKHRIAACSLAGRPRVQCRMWTGSPAQERLLRASDNAFPRDDYDAWVHELVDAQAAVISEERAAHSADKLSGEPQRGGQKTVRGEARERAAALIGRSSEAVRKADERGDPDRRERKLDVQVPDGAGGFKPYESEAPAAGTVVEPPKPPSPESIVKRFLPRTEADPSCPLHELLVALGDIETHYKPYAGATEEKHGRLTPAAVVFADAKRAGEALREAWDLSERVLKGIGLIHANLRKAYAPGPKTGLRGAKL